MWKGDRWRAAATACLAPGSRELYGHMPCPSPRRAFPTLLPPLLLRLALLQTAWPCGSALDQPASTSPPLRPSIKTTSFCVGSSCQKQGGGRGAGRGRGRGKRTGTDQVSPTLKSKREAKCQRAVHWAMKTGIVDHPERYPGLTPQSTVEQFRQRLHETMPTSGCPDAKGSYSMTSGLPTFTESLTLNSSQLTRYRRLRIANAAQLEGDAFKALNASQRNERRRELATDVAREMRRFLNASQWAVFVNQSAALRRPPAMHLAASIGRSWGSAATPAAGSRNSDPS